MRRSARAPVSPIVITVGASLLVVLGVAWGAGPLPPSARAAAVVTAVAPKCVPLESVPFGPPSGTHHVTGTGVEDGPLGLYAFVPAEGVVASGHPVDIRLEVHNGGNAAVSFSFATAQRYDVVIWDDECKEVWRWSSGRMFAQALQSMSISGHGKIIYHISWPQRDQSGHQVRTGGYEAQVVFLGKGQWDGPVVLPPLTFAVR